MMTLADVALHFSHLQRYTKSIYTKYKLFSCILQKSINIYILNLSYYLKTNNKELQYYHIIL